MPEIQERFHWVKILCIVLWEEPISADQIPTAWNIMMSKQILIHKMGKNVRNSQNSHFGAAGNTVNSRTAASSHFGSNSYENAKSTGSVSEGNVHFSKYGFHKKSIKIALAHHQVQLSQQSKHAIRCLLIKGRSKAGNPQERDSRSRSISKTAEQEYICRKTCRRRIPAE